MTRGEFDVSLGEVVRRACIAAGISVTDLARHLGRSRSWVALRELGFRRLHKEETERLLEIIRLVVNNRRQVMEARISNDGSRESRTAL